MTQPGHPTATLDEQALRELPPPVAPAGRAWPPPAAAPKHHGRATAALALGVTSLLGLVFVLPAALGPLACYLGVSARREIEREPARWTGHGQATAGMVLGIISSVLLLLVVLLMVAAASMFALALQIDTGYGP